MTIPKTEAKQLLEKIIFEETSPQDWVEVPEWLSYSYFLLSTKIK